MCRADSNPMVGRNQRRQDVRLIRLDRGTGVWISFAPMELQWFVIINNKRQDRPTSHEITLFIRPGDSCLVVASATSNKAGPNSLFSFFMM